MIAITTGAGTINERVIAYATTANMAHEIKQLIADAANYEAARKEDAARIDALVAERDALKDALAEAVIELRPFMGPQVIDFLKRARKLLDGTNGA